MKRTTRINIGNLIFNIDEDAYELLDKYLQSIDDFFASSREGKEILSDIENRIAEHFSKIISKSKEVISITDVKDVISAIGHPGDFEDSNPTLRVSDRPKVNFDGRLYRDIENRWIGGVAAGLAAYFGIDPVIPRIIFILLGVFGGGGVLIYLIIWMVAPPAETTLQRMAMRGENINLRNIEDVVKKEFNEVKNSWNKRKF